MPREPDPITGFDYRYDTPPSRAKALRMKCLECCCGSKHEVKHCRIFGCANWAYRMGGGITQSEDGTKKRTRNVSEAVREAARQRMKKK